MFLRNAKSLFYIMILFCTLNEHGRQMSFKNGEIISKMSYCMHLSLIYRIPDSLKILVTTGNDWSNPFNWNAATTILHFRSL